MTKDLISSDFWPLGALSYSTEIRECFPVEAEMLGTITILWTRQELALRRIFLALIASKRKAYAEAIWDRQPTHLARRELLALALHATNLSKRQTGILKWVLEKTKAVADRRNELIHAEYVVQFRTENLHAKVKSPRSSKPPKHQRAMESDLKTVIDDLDGLVQATEAAWSEYWPRSLKRQSKQLSQLADRLRPAS